MHIIVLRHSSDCVFPSIIYYLQNLRFDPSGQVERVIAFELEEN